MAKVILNGKDHLLWQRPSFMTKAIFHDKGPLKWQRPSFMAKAIFHDKGHLSWVRPSFMAKAILNGKEHLLWQRPSFMAKTIFNAKGCKVVKIPVRSLMLASSLFRCRFLRNKDRDIHRTCYPTLFYPELYILEGGYRDFFNEKKVRNSPCQRCLV